MLLTATHITTQGPTSTIAPATSETPSPTATRVAFNSLASPNGEFVANAYHGNELLSRIPIIEVQNKEGKLIWQIPFQGEIPTTYPRRELDIFQWAKDSSKLYFYYVLDPDGGNQSFWWTGLDLQELNIKTGKTSPVLPGEGFMSFSISPDGTQIAYIRRQDQPSVIYIRNISSGIEKTAYILNDSSNFTIEGDIYWSPKGNRIAFQTQDSDYMVQTIYLNLDTLKQKVIKKYLVHTFEFQGWTNDEKLEFWEYAKNGAQIIQINVRNNISVVIGTPTPSP